VTNRGPGSWRRFATSPRLRSGWIHLDGPVAYAADALDAPTGREGEGIEPLPDELSTVLTSQKIQLKIDKLAATGLEERHLLLHVRPSAFSFPVYDGLSFGGQLPSRPACLPGSLNQVWLVSGWAVGGVVRALADGTWHRDHPFDPRSSTAAAICWVSWDDAPLADAIL
jgi:hypothetical protein